MNVRVKSALKPVVIPKPERWLKFLAPHTAEDLVGRFERSGIRSTLPHSVEGFLKTSFLGVHHALDGVRLTRFVAEELGVAKEMPFKDFRQRLVLKDGRLHELPSWAFVMLSMLLARSWEFDLPDGLRIFGYVNPFGLDGQTLMIEYDHGAWIHLMPSSFPITRVRPDDWVVFLH